MGGLNTKPTSSQVAGTDQGKAVKAKIDAGQDLTYDDVLIAKQAGFDLNKKPTSKLSLIPDLTDQAVQARKMAQATQLLSGNGRKQSFLGGDYSSSSLGGGSILGGGS
jgi:hypothetical protein